MVKSGPVDPVFMAFIIPKILQRILEIIWEHPGQHIIFGNLRLKNFGNVGTYPHSHIAT